MKPATVLLAIFTALSAFPAILLGHYCLFSPASAVMVLHLDGVTPSVEFTFLMIGSFLWATALLHILTVIWLLRKTKAAIALALALSIFNLFRGVIMLVTFQAHGITSSFVAYLVTAIGIVMLILSMIAVRQEKLPS